MTALKSRHPSQQSKGGEAGFRYAKDTTAEKHLGMPESRDLEATIAIAGYNCEVYLEQAVISALCQEVPLEVIIVDDASTDGTAALAHRLARDDPRIRVIQLPVNMGPAAARNTALRAARGRWFCILDADDLMHPDRLKTLIACAEAEDADLIADDLIVFDDADIKPATRFLTQHEPGSCHWLTLVKYLQSTRMSTNRPNLGYLKPIIRLSRLKHAGIWYAEQLRIGEDDHFVLSMLLAGFRYRVMALPCYYYRKHSSSISHRLSRETIEQIADVARGMKPSLKLRSTNEKKAFAARLRSVTNTAAFVSFLEHLRSRAWNKAIQELVCNPGAIPLLRQPLLDRLRKWAARQARHHAQGQEVLVVSRTSHAHLAAAAAERIRTMGYTPAHLVIDDRFGTVVTATGRSFTTAATHIPNAYFQRQASGATVASARLAILKLARRAKFAVVVAPVPKLLAREFLHFSTPITSFDDDNALTTILPSQSNSTASADNRMNYDNG